MEVVRRNSASIVVKITMSWQTWMIQAQPRRPAITVVTDLRGTTMTPDQVA